MLKKVMILVGACVLGAQALTIEHFGAKPEITMIAVPRDATAVRIVNDISRLHPILQVCYQQSGDQMQIHAWNGERWIAVSTEDYTNGVFFANPPAHAIIVEAEDAPAPELLVPDGTWCADGNRITSTDPRVMIDLLGRYFDFPYRVWKDFSIRYELPLEEINPAFINTYWYHHYGEDIFKKRALVDKKADMDKWLYLDITPPAPVEPVVIEEPEPLAPAEVPATQELIEEMTAPTEEDQTPEITEPAEEKEAPVLEETIEAEEPEPVPAMEPVEASEPESVEAPEEIPNAPEALDPFTATNIPAAEIVLPPKQN